MQSIIRKFNKSVMPSRRIPRSMRTILLVALLASGPLSGMYYGGYTDILVSSAGRTIGLDSISVSVSGNKKTTKENIIEQIEINETTNLANFDTNKAHEKILELPWVENVEIAIFYPNKMKIKITENKAFGIWQNQGQIKLIKQNGETIKEISEIDYIANRYGTELYDINGDNAAEHADEIVKIIEKFEMGEDVKTYSRIGDRRWNVELNNNVNILLPQNDVEEALKFLVEADKEFDIYERPIKYVDLRLKDRVVLGLTEHGIKSREEFVKENGEIALNKIGETQ